jgi:hypothetical protein
MKRMTEPRAVQRVLHRQPDRTGIPIRRYNGLAERPGNAIDLVLIRNARK